jgi:hypothetical protein
MKYCWLPLPPWNVWILVVIGSDEAAVVKLIKRHRSVNAEFAGRDGFAIVQPGSWTIWLRRLNVEWLVHEAFHIVTCVLKHRGMRLSDKSDEAYAYALQWLVAHVLAAKWKTR